MVRYLGLLLIAVSLLSPALTKASFSSSDWTSSALRAATENGTSSTTTHQITVGGTNGLVYTPNNITASIGDIIQFNFESENHTATQSSFASPCEKLAGGVDSGFMPNPNNTLSPAPTMTYQVTTTSPVWMFCAQTGHCGMGMVFAINPTAEESFDAFRVAAMAQNGTGASTATASASGTSSSSSAVAVASQGTSAAVVLGTGVLSNSKAACSCACLCGSADFPAGAGVGAVGGVGGKS
jgi:plastocyanin